MSFVYVWVLWLLLPLFAYVYRRKQKQSFRQNLRWAVLVLVLIALARPVLPQSVGQEEIQGHSLVFALDLSRSMNGDDIKPSRALASRESIKGFLELQRYEQIALVGFTINPLLLSPPTTDHHLVQLALENMKAEYILTKGTDLRKLFEKIAQFKEQEKRVILFSDGGDEVLDEGLSTFLEEENIKLLAIAMATQQGASLPKKDGTLVKDEEGNIVISKLNRSLAYVAKQSGGSSVPFVSVDNTIEQIEAWLDKEESQNKALKRERKSYVELAFVPLIFALMLFFFSATKFANKLLALFLLLGLNLQAEELLTREAWGEGETQEEVNTVSWGFFDAYYLQRAYSAYENEKYQESQAYLHKIKAQSLESQVLLAHIFYKEEKYQEAKSILQGIKSRNKTVKQQIYYELGNCEAKLAYMDKAKNYYVKALQLGKDEDALHNLEVVLFRLNEEASTVGYTNPSSAQKSKSESENVESSEAKNAEKKESKGASGGTGNKQSKSATVKVIQSNEEGDSKRTFSSKAYDLINEGYIREEKPW